jgi:large subunit ribosomal protein L25
MANLADSCRFHSDSGNVAVCAPDVGAGHTDLIRRTCIRAEWSREADRQMAHQYSLEATKRTMTGKRVRRLRANGQVPAVVYGTVVQDPISITLEERDLMRTYQAIGGSSLMDLHLDGETYTVYIRNMHMNPIKRRPIHAEFFAPDLLVAMTAPVPLHLVGEVEDDRLVVMQTRDTIELRGLPEELPGAFEVDISGLVEVDDSIFVRDLVAPEGVEIITDEDEMIVRLTEPRMVSEEEEAEEAAIAEAAAEEAAEGEEPADEDTEDESDES